MNWTHFSPRGNGGSFGREDMGEFCEVNSVLFVVPLFASSISQAQMTDIEARVKECLKRAKPGEVFEWSSDEFTREPSIDWREKLKTSSLSQLLFFRRFHESGNMFAHAL